MQTVYINGVRATFVDLYTLFANVKTGAEKILEMKDTKCGSLAITTI